MKRGQKHTRDLRRFDLKVLAAKGMEDNSIRDSFIGQIKLYRAVLVKHFH